MLDSLRSYGIWLVVGVLLVIIVVQFALRGMQVAPKHTQEVEVDRHDGSGKHHSGCC